MKTSQSNKDILTMHCILQSRGRGEDSNNNIWWHYERYTTQVSVTNLDFVVGMSVLLRDELFVIKSHAIDVVVSSGETLRILFPSGMQNVRGITTSGDNNFV